METQATSTVNIASSEDKAKWRVTNWPEYDRALVQRGNLTVWFDEEFVQKHWRPDPTGKRGSPMKYSDMAIQVLLTLKATFGLPYRALEGFGRLLMKLMGLEFDIPDHSHMSRQGYYGTDTTEEPYRTKSHRGGLDRIEDIRRR